MDPVRIAQMVAKGFTIEYVAAMHGVCHDTLYANYSQAIKNGIAFRNGCLQARQFQNAMAKNNTTMQIWLGKQWLGQRDRIENTHSFEEVESGDLPLPQLPEGEKVQ